MVVCTVNNAGDSKLHIYLQLTFTSVDEAAYIIKPSAVITVAWNLMGPFVYVGGNELKMATDLPRPVLLQDLVDGARREAGGTPSLHREHAPVTPTPRPDHAERLRTIVDLKKELDDEQCALHEVTPVRQLSLIQI